MIDLKTGNPMTNCYQYPARLFCYNDLVKNYDKYTYTNDEYNPEYLLEGFSMTKKRQSDANGRSKSG